MNIALVRGHHLSKEETVSYEPLRGEYNFHCFSTNSPWFNLEAIQFPITRLPSMEGLFRFLPGMTGARLFSSMDNVLGTGQWMVGLERALRGFDIVHTSDYCHLFSWQAARARRTGSFKLVAIHYENIPFAREEKFAIRATKPEIYARVDRFAMSERARAALLLEGVEPGRIDVIGNAIDTTVFRPRPESNDEWRLRLGLKLTDVVVLFIGRIHESKGVFELLSAAHRLIHDPAIDAARLRFVLAGRGKRLDEVRARITRLGLQQYVRIVGSVPHAEIHHFHTIADVFTLPSIAVKHWQEQFGIVLIESMACAKAVVGTLSGSIPEVLGDAGILVQPNDHLSLAEGLKRLIVNPELRVTYGTRARQRVEEHFSTERIATKLRAAYRSVLEGETSAA
jgi:glycosyltransferase involved in cell wall biosynthesis